MGCFAIHPSVTGREPQGVTDVAECADFAAANGTTHLP